MSSKKSDYHKIITTIVDADFEPRLYDGDGDLSKRWYIEYRIWDTDKLAYVRKQYCGMNRFRTLKERRRVAKEKLAELHELLMAGYTAGQSPAAHVGIDMSQATVLDAVQFVQDNKHVSDRSSEELPRLIRRLKEFPALGALRVKHVQPMHVAAFMKNLSARKLAPKTWNHYRNNLSGVWNYLLKMELVTKNPVKAIDNRKVEASEQHRPYTEAQRQQITQLIEKRQDEQLLLFLSFIYYCFVRSGGELRLLQVKDIRQKTIRIPSTRSKNDKGEHVAILKQLERMIERHELRSYPPDYYVFTQDGKPGLKPVGKNFFSRRHRVILEEAELDGQGYTVYGYKHTGAINLYLATRDIELVRRHCRHAHAGMTANYLRALGVLTDADALDQMPDF